MANIKFDDTTYEYDKLAEKYGNFFAPGFEVNIEGTNIVVSEGMSLTNLTVTTSVSSESNYCTFQIANAYDWVKREFKWLKDYFEPGKAVEVKLGYVDKLETVFIGLMTEIKFHYPEGGSPRVIVTCMDHSYQLMKGTIEKPAEYWDKKAHSDVVKEIVGNYKLTQKQVDDTPANMKIARGVWNDFQFISDLAKANNYEFFVIGKDLYFREPYKKTSPVLTLEYGKTLTSFSLTVDIASQVKQVIVHGRDENNQYIEAKSETPKVFGSNSKTGVNLVSAIDSKMKIYHESSNISDKDALQKRANAIAMEISMKLVSGEGVSVGIPEMIAGRAIKLNGLGGSLNGLMYLNRVTHTIDASGFKTIFSVQGNAI